MGPRDPESKGRVAQLSAFLAKLPGVLPNSVTMPERSWGRRSVLLGLGALGLCTLALPPSSLAQQVLHERFEPDPIEELALHATTENGRLPAALDTRMGPVSAPPQNPEVGGEVYGGKHLAGVGTARYRLDSLTGPPEQIRYHDPFRPGTAPYKRLYAYDHVKADFSLDVHTPELTGVSTESVATARDEAFYADFFVDLRGAVPVRIVSVAPGARIVALYSEPEQRLEVLEDGAENWFIRGQTSERVRVVMQLAAPRRAFTFRARLGNFRTIESDLPVPSFVEEAARPVLAAIGVSRNLAPSVALERLVAYFRNFRASVEVPVASDPVALYRELSLGRRGVCRHRAFAFVVTALSLGFRARMVHNEAHAWVEVFDGDGFARIDLGGAAPELLPVALDPNVPLYEPEPDPFAWPFGESSGHALGQRMHQTLRAPTTSSWPGSVQSSRAPDLPSGAGLPEVGVELRLRASKIQRGGLLEVSGRAQGAGRACAHVRLDVFLERSDGSRELLGSTLTDREGRFLGHVTVPRDAPLGQTHLLAEVAGPC
jgi:hypothetical protein